VERVDARDETTKGDERARDGAVAGSVATNERANADRVGANHEV
jgi:hypothetical protein